MRNKQWDRRESLICPGFGLASGALNHKVNEEQCKWSGNASESNELEIPCEVCGRFWWVMVIDKASILYWHTSVNIVVEACFDRKLTWNAMPRTALGTDGVSERTRLFKKLKNSRNSERSDTLVLISGIFVLRFALIEPRSYFIQQNTCVISDIKSSI